MASNNISDEKIRARFITSYEEYKIPEAPLSIPSKLNRSGLTEVINHLLGRDDHQAFDFLIDGHILRQSLSKLLYNLRKSTENVIIIEYIPAVTLSENSEGNELPAWIGSIDCSFSDIICTGCYDGSIHILNSADQSNLTSIQAHDEPIRSILTLNHNNNQLIATASKDQTVKLHKLSQNTINNIISLSSIVTLEGHINSVECLSCMPENSLLLSGDWSGNIFAWDIKSEEIRNNIQYIDSHPTKGHNSDSSNKKNSRKKLKTNKHDDTTSTTNTNNDNTNNDDIHLNNTPIKSLFTIHAHAQKISGLRPYSETQFLTSSWDHTIKLYELETQNCIHTISTTRVITSIDYNINNQLISTSHTDGKIRLWDLRQQQKADQNSGFGPGAGTAAVSVYGKDSNTQWISQV